MVTMTTVRINNDHENVDGYDDVHDNDYNDNDYIGDSKQLQNFCMSYFFLSIYLK